MAYITEYYFDIKLIDKTSPVKRRLEIFRRSTHEHLMTVPAANIPNDGIFVTTNLDPAIPAKDIYALAFDDVGNRQLAGADKLSIKSRQVWVEQELVCHIEYNPDETSNERVSNAPLIINRKSVEQDFVNGTLTTFNATTPTITEYGLCYHDTQTNIQKNDYITDTLTTVVQTTYKTLTLCQVRETTETGVHSCKNVVTNIPQTADAYAIKNTLITRYFKPNGRTKFQLKTYQSDLTTILLNITVNLSAMTCTVTNGIEGRIEIDPRFPDYYLLLARFALPTTKIIGLETITLLDDSGQSSYLGDVTKGIDIWNIRTSGNSTYACFGSLPIPLTTSSVTLQSRLNPNGTSIYSYCYNLSLFNSNFIKTLAYNSTNDTLGKSIMIDLSFSMTISSAYLKAKGTTVNDFIIGNSNVPCLGIVQNELRFYYCPTDTKATTLIAFPSFDAYDVLRLRVLGGKYSDLPSNIKQTYSIPENKGFCRVIIENLTKGTKIVHHSNTANHYFMVNTSLIDLAVRPLFAMLFSDNIGLIYMKKLKIWDKPLPADWESWT